MPSFQDSAFIILLGLLLFGPKGLAKIARQLGKLVGEFRRASTEFRMQMEDELRISEQADQQKKIAAMEAAAPVAPYIAPEPVEHIPPAAPDLLAHESAPKPIHEHPIHEATPEPEPTPAPLPIASSGSLDLMPPATGLPISRSDPGRSASSSSLSGVFDSIPHTPESHAQPNPEHVHEAANGAELHDPSGLSHAVSQAEVSANG